MMRRALCLLALAVMPIQALAQTIDVDVNADATNPYRFKHSDFGVGSGRFTFNFNFSTGSYVGNLIINGRRIAHNENVDGISSDDIPNIVYYPASTGLATNNDYTRMSFLAAGQFKRFTVRLVAAGTGQLAASGAPTVTAATGTAYNEDVALTAASTGITEPNTIDTSTLTWAWQQADAPATGTPADGDYSAISGATTTAFTPLQAHVGKYLRACASFTDSHASDPRQETLCSTGTIITGVEDAPVGADSTVNVSSNVTMSAPHDFAELDFPFTDDDPGDMIDGIRIISLPAKGTLIVADDSSVTIAVNTNLSRAQLRALAWYPPANAEAKDNFTSFDYRVISSGGTPNVATEDATLTINLVSPLDATGTPAVTYASSSITVPTEDSAIIANQGTIEDPDNSPTNSLGTISWQWFAADPPAMGAALDSDDFIEVTGANTDSFTPVQTNVGQFLRVCASFTDAAGDMESKCHAIPTAVANANDEPAGRVAVRRSDHPEVDSIHTGALPEDIPWVMADTTNGGTLMDEDGLPTGNERYTDPGEGISWQTSGDNGATWTEVLWTSDKPGTGNSNHYTSDRPGGLVRACLFYFDEFGHLEGGDSTSPASRAETDNNAATCSVGVRVFNINDNPVAGNLTINVPVTASESNPYTINYFSFPFEDQDGDPIDNLGVWPPSAGTLRLVSGGDIVNRGRTTRNHVQFWPAANQDPTDPNDVDASYATFRFNVTDKGMRGVAAYDPRPFAPNTSRHNTQSNQATVTIRLVTGEQTAATGAPTVTPAADQSTGYAEDAELTASTDGVSDINGIDQGRLSWAWQQSAPVNDAAPAADSNTWAAIMSDGAAVTTATFTPDQPHVGQYIRVCLTFFDTHPTTAAEEGPLCSAGAQVSNSNDEPTGMPAVTADGVAVTAAPDEDVELTAARGTIADSDGVATFTPTWAWHEGDTLDGDFTAIMQDGAAVTGATFTPMQAHVDKFIRVCATFADDNGASGNACWTSPAAVANVNDAPNIDGLVISPTTPTEDAQITLTTGITDEDGINTSTFVPQWQSAASAAGPFTDISDEVGTTITPGDALVDQHLQVCITYTDDEGETTTVCKAFGAVVNVNDRPMADNGEVSVPAIADADRPYLFSPADFSITDADGDSLTHVIITRVPVDGTLRVGETVLTADNVATEGSDIAVAAIGTIAYWPDEDPPVGEGYSSITWNAVDDGDGPGGDRDSNKQSNNGGRISIRIVPGAQTPATGMPTVTPAADMNTGYAEDAPLTASTNGITEINGIDDSTLQWAWQQAPAPASGAPADAAFVPITRPADDGTPTPVTDATFTPNQPQVGMHIRVCVRFDDDHPDAEAALTTALCSTSAVVANANDAPATADNAVSAFTSADANTPYVFKVGDFPFTDDDAGQASGGTLVSISVTSAANNGTLRVGETVLTADNVAAEGSGIAVADIATLIWWPPTGTAATSEYANFTFTVSDGALSSATGRMSINLVAPGPIAATGAPTVTPAADMDSGYAEDVQLTANTIGIIEPNTIDESTLQWVWQQAATQNGTWADIEGSAPARGATSTTFTPLQAHVGMHLRVCASFSDLGTDPAAEGPVCSDPAPVANVNDAPMAEDRTIYVSLEADMADPYNFTAADFPFTDEDGDSLASITLASVPDDGTLSNGDDPAAVNDVIEVADLGDLTYYPAAGQEAETGYASFTFNVTDDGDGPAGDAAANKTSTTAATITINLLSPEQQAASGAPGISPTAHAENGYAEDAQLTASISGITEPNGINEDSLQWVWQQAPVPASGEPADASFTAIPGATAATFTPDQPQVGMHIRVCVSFMDLHTDLTTGAPTPASEGPLCSASAPVANANDAPVARNTTYQAVRDGGNNTIAIPASAFAAAYMDADPDDMLAAITITDLPDETHGTLRYGENGDADDAAVAEPQTLDLNDDGTGFADDNVLTFTIAASAGNLQETELMFKLTDDNNAESADPATLTLTFGKDIQEEQVKQVGAILGVAAITNATNAISGAISGAGTTGAVPAPTFDISMGGTSLVDMGRSLHRNLGPTAPATAATAISDDNTHLPAGIATRDQRAWFLGTNDGWEYQAAHNATDNSAAALMARLNALARGDIGLQYNIKDLGRLSSMRIWARYQSLDLSGNEGQALEYDGSSTGFYIGVDNQITDTIRAGLAIGTDSADISLDIDDDRRSDDASRSATSFYPYMHIDLGNNNKARVIAAFGSGTLDIKSSANQASASSDLSWNMLAASISHHKDLNDKLGWLGGLQEYLGPVADKLTARFDGSLQLGNSSASSTRFSNGSRLTEGASSTNEIGAAAELQYHHGALSPTTSITPFASLATRKLGGDLSQSLVFDLAFGADLITKPATIRLGITRQLNAATHQRNSISLDAATTPNALGITASLGSRYDSITGRPQWNTTIGWQQGRLQTSLQASPGAYRLRARLRW